VCIMPRRTFGWHMYLCLDPEEGGGVGLGALTLDTHLDPWVDG